MEELLGLVDLVLLDVKQFNPDKHLSLTERKNEQTLKTAEWLEKNVSFFYQLEELCLK